MKWRKASEAPPFFFEKMLSPVLVLTTLWWICMALPGWPSIGLAMKVA